STEIRRVNEHRVDNQRSRGIVRVKMESNPIAVRLCVAARNLHAMAAGLLIDDGRLQANFSVAGLEDEIATNVHSNVPSAFKRQLDRIRVGAWSDEEVVLELLLVAVVNEVHSGIDALVFDFPVPGNLRVPVPASVADDVVALPWQFVFLRHARLR